jgi:glycosidase
MPRSVREIDLSPIPGKEYWSIDREWREEFIYFLMVDRFQDDVERHPEDTASRANPRTTADQLRRFCGGRLRGIIRNLDYIHNLGCSAIWLSPIFENDGAPDPRSGSYHGYAIRNYLEVDPRFGTKDDLIELVDQAHRRKMRVFLDAVANHCGDVWHYPGDVPYYYSDDNRQFEIGGWRSPDYPVPVELRNPAYFNRRGEIRAWSWDRLPETQWGDFFSLKGFNNDDDPAGLELQRIIIDAHRYWMREADIDGYRMDAVKHMGERAIARFCSEVREYAHRLGKRQFFLFGELVGGDDAINRYTGPNTASLQGDCTIYYGLDSVLDFPLYWTLPAVIKGFAPPSGLFGRYEALRDRALSRGELGRFLVTFIDNHDQIGQMYKRRFAAGAMDEQVIAAAGYTICALGTPCLYYGTEQGLSGEGPGDEFIREPLFDLAGPDRTHLNPRCRIYQEIAKIAAVNRRIPALRFGRMYFRETSFDGRGFGLPQGLPCILAFSRILDGQEVLVAYNTSISETLEASVVVDCGIHRPGETIPFLYGGDGGARVEAHPDPGNGTRSVRLRLGPMQFVILG